MASWSSCDAFVYKKENQRFKSGAGQIRHGQRLATAAT